MTTAANRTLEPPFHSADEEQPDVFPVWINDEIFQDKTFLALPRKSVRLLFWMLAHPHTGWVQKRAAKRWLEIPDHAPDFDSMFNSLLDILPRLEQYFSYQKPSEEAQADVFTISFVRAESFEADYGAD